MPWGKKKEQGKALLNKLANTLPTWRFAHSYDGF
jgi:hypothetical protein